MTGKPLLRLRLRIDFRLRINSAVTCPRAKSLGKKSLNLRDFNMSAERYSLDQN